MIKTFSAELEPRKSRTCTAVIFNRDTYQALASTHSQKYVGVGKLIRNARFSNPPKKKLTEHFSL